MRQLLRPLRVSLKGNLRRRLKQNLRRKLRQNLRRRLKQNLRVNPLLHLLLNLLLSLKRLKVSPRRSKPRNRKPASHLKNPHKSLLLKIQIVNSHRKRVKAIDCYRS